MSPDTRESTVQAGYDELAARFGAWVLAREP